MKKKFKEPKIYFADFETTTIDSKQYKEENHFNVWLWGIAPQIKKKYDFEYSELEVKKDKGKKLSDDEEHQIQQLVKQRKDFVEKEREKVIVGDTIDSFYQKIVEIAFSDKPNIIIYFHNLSWDGNYIVKYLHRQNELYYVQEIDIEDKNKFNNKMKNKSYFVVFETDNNILNIQLTINLYLL